jgi:hypothetical protein
VLIKGEVIDSAGVFDFTLGEGRDKKVFSASKRTMGGTGGAGILSLVVMFGGCCCLTTTRGNGLSPFGPMWCSRSSDMWISSISSGGLGQSHVNNMIG